MGTVEQTITFVVDLVPTAADWANQFSSLYNLVNGQIDKANVDSSSSDGIVTMDEAQTITGAKTLTGALVANGGAVFNEGSADVDFRIETNAISNGFIVDGGLDVFAFGAAAADDQFVTISPPAATHTATTNTYNLQVGSGGAQTIPTGTTTYVGTVNLDEPNITATGTVTNAFTLRIAGAPTEGSNNYALWVDAGATQLDGAVTAGSTLTVGGVLSVDDTTETTSGTTGSIHTDGGLGVAKDIYLGDDLFIATGAVFNWDGGDVTLTHSANTLTLGGGNMAFGTGTLTVAALLANSDNSGALGASGTAFSDLFLADGGVINWNAGNATLTHTAGTLTFNGDFVATDVDAIIGSNTPAALTCTTFTSTGIDDNATGEILQITDSGATVAGDFSATDLDGILGSNTAAAATVTTLTASGIVSVDDTTDSTSTTTGSIHTDGGVGIAKDLILGATSTIFVGDTENARQAVGITIQQGTNDDEALALKSSDVVHVVTGVAESDTYGVLSKASATAGGLQITGLRDGDDNPWAAVTIRGILDEAAADTTKSTGGFGVIQCLSYLESGNSVGLCGADENLFSISNGGTTRFIFDAEGSGHADVAWTTYDAEDDFQIVKDVEAHFVPELFGEAVKYKAKDLERLGLFHDIRREPDGKMRGMMNWTRMSMFHHGTLHKVIRALEDAYAEIGQLKSRLQLIGA